MNAEAADTVTACAEWVDHFVPRRGNRFVD